MGFLTVYETPSVKIDHLLTTFMGWPDAGEGASGALRYFLRKLSAKKFAELDPEEFYDFTDVRPHISLNSEGIRQLKWPSNELYFSIGPKADKGLMFLVGTEPNLRWKTYCSTIMDVAVKSGVKTVIHVGALLDAVPHTREVRLTGAANRPDFKKTLEKMGIFGSSYQGPAGISSAMMEHCTQRGLFYATLWGHAPHYLQASPNYQVRYALVRTLSRLLRLDMETEELGSAALTFQREVQKVVDKDTQIKAYVEELEQRYDEAALASEGSPEAEDVVRELEEYLRGQRGGNGDAPPR